jgi:hypothetical protein
MINGETWLTMSVPSRCRHGHQEKWGYELKRCAIVIDIEMFSL